MKKAVIFFISLIMVLCLGGCGEEEDDRVLFQDDGVSLVNDDTAEKQDNEVLAQIQEERDANTMTKEYYEANVETLDKDAYDKYMAELPKNVDGTVNNKDFSPEQQAIYDKFVNGLYVTSFSIEEVQKDILDFFSDNNLQRIKTAKYNECINQFYGKEYNEDADKYQNITYTATVYDDFTNRVILNGEVIIHAGTDSVTYKYDYTCNYVEDFYYGFKKLQNKNHVDTLYFIDKNYKQDNPFKELQYLFNNGVSDLIIESHNNNVYVCSFKVDNTAFMQTYLMDRQYIEPIFKQQKGLDNAAITGTIYVDYNTNKITKVIFNIQLNENDRTIITYEFLEYNDTKHTEQMEGNILAFDDALMIQNYIEDARAEYMKDPTNLIKDKSEEEQEKILAEYRKQQRLEEANQGTPEGMRSLVDINGNRVRDIEGNAIYLYEDTLIPVNPMQIPMGTMTPIGDQPIEDGILQTIVGY